MIKKATNRAYFNEKKVNHISRLLMLFHKVQNKFQFRNIALSFAKLRILNSKDPRKLKIVQFLKKKYIQQAFFTIKSYQKSFPSQKIFLSALKNLSLSILTHFFNRKRIKNQLIGFSKLKKLKKRLDPLKTGIFLSSLIHLIKNFERKNFLSYTMQRLRKIGSNQNKLNLFFKSLNSYIERTKKSCMEQSFSLIASEGFRRTHLNDLKIRQQKITQSKNHQLSKQQQYRILRSQINALAKIFQYEQDSKKRNNKEEYDRNLILQAKNSQRERNEQELKRVVYQNENLTYQLKKKNGYLKIKQDRLPSSENAQVIFRKTYDILNLEKIKQSISFKEISIFFNRENIDMNQILKKFSLSKQTFIDENIYLKNTQNLYEKQMPRYGIGVDIKESQTYRKTMEQNVNLRQLLQILFSKALQDRQNQIEINKEQLCKIIKTKQKSQESSKITLKTQSTLTGGYSQ